MTHTLRPRLNFTFTAFPTCVLLLPLVGGCREPIQDSLDEQPRYGTLDVRIHDAPVDASAVIVTPVALSLKQCSGGGFIVIQTEPASLDLLKLVDGELATIVDGAEIPIGKYCEARLVLAPVATLVDGDGVAHDLETPSATTSGYKIKDVEFEVIPGDIRTVLHVDFDVEQSIVERSNGSFGLKPVLRADSTSYQTLAGGRAPQGDYIDYAAFSVTPGQPTVVALGGGAQIAFPAGAVLEETEFIATRWAPYAESVRSDIFHFSPHYRFLATPVLSVPYDDVGAPLDFRSDYDLVDGTFVEGMASASLSHFSDEDVNGPCAIKVEDAYPKGYNCNGTETRLYLCDGNGKAQTMMVGDKAVSLSWGCECKKEDPGVDDGCYWEQAPWEGCLRLSESRTEPYHDGEYRTDGRNIALDFPRLDKNTTKDLLCGFEECELKKDCRKDVYGNNLCILERKQGQATGVWMFVAHLETHPELADIVSKGTKIGVMGNTGPYSQGIHFHIEYGSTGNASKINDAGDFPAPFDAYVRSKMRFCAGAPEAPLDVIPEPPPPLPAPPAPTTEACDQLRVPTQQCMAVKKFSDMPELQDPTCWWCAAVQNLACVDVIKGYGDGMFKPTANVTRAEFLKMVLETAFPCATFVANGALPFPDIAGKWYEGIAAFAHEKGIVGGIVDPRYADSVFNGDELLTREQAVAILNRAGIHSTIVGYKKLRMALVNLPVIPDNQEFADVGNPNDWFYNYVYAAKDAGVTTGYGGDPNRFGVRDPLRRAEAATFVARTAGYE